jgi:MarR family transcriptional regulator, lower aerobic nicotinate degradation pathway regulator
LDAGRPTTPDKPSYRLEEQVGFVLRRVHQRATDIFNTVMAGFDITPRQFATLAKLDDLGPTSQNQLGRLVAMDPATMNGVAGRLIKRGLLRQSPDPNDARLVLLELTDAGRSLIEATRRRRSASKPSSANWLPNSASCANPWIAVHR